MRRFAPPQGRPAAAGPHHDAKATQPSSGPAQGFSRNCLLLLLVLVLVPVNLYVFSRTSEPSALLSSPAPAVGQKAVDAPPQLRHVFTRPPKDEGDEEVEDEVDGQIADEDDEEEEEEDGEEVDSAVGIVKEPATQQVVFHSGEPLPVQVPGLVQGKRKTFVYFRSKSCTHICQRAKSVGFTPGILDFANRVYPDLLMIRWNVYGRYSHLTKTVINQVGSGGSCIGGGKGIQLVCRQTLASKHGCDFADLQIQPHQWNIQKQPQCESFFQTAALAGNEEKIWIMKPGGSFHGRGITLHRGNDAELRSTYGDCRRKLPDGLIVQEYVMKPALMGGHKFDLRTYLLIASTKPHLVFYHDGFARRSSKPYSVLGSDLTDPLAHITNDARQSEENHFFGFHQLERVLVKEWNFPEGYFEQYFIPRAMRVTNFLFHTTTSKLQPVSGRYQFFALDWMIDQDGVSMLLEGNGDPSVKHYPDTDLTPGLWESMLELVERVHYYPAVLGKVQVQGERYRYKGWRLVYNQLEALSEPYQPCKVNQYERDNHPLYGFNPV